MAEKTTKPAVVVGQRMPPGALVQHALVIKRLAEADLPAFKAEGLLNEDALAQVDALIEAVHKGLEERTTKTIRARMQSAQQAQAARTVKVARRRLNHCVERVFRGQPELAQYRQSSYHGSGIAAICTDLNQKLAFAKKHQQELTPAGATPALVANLEWQVRDLEELSGAQNAAQAQLPDHTRAFGEAKNRLYSLVKDIISAGQALHAARPEVAAKYNSKALYRKNSRAETEAETNAEDTTSTASSLSNETAAPSSGVPSATT